MTQFLKSIAAPVAALSAMAFVAMAAPASAGEFCYTNTSGMRSCSFSTMEQCKASVSGVFGNCYRDPFLPDNSNALAYQPKQPVARHGGKPVEKR
jgi:hypothetical protein